MAEQVPRNSKRGKISLEASPSWLLSAKYAQPDLVLYEFQPILLYGPLLTPLWWTQTQKNVTPPLHSGKDGSRNWQLKNVQTELIAKMLAAHPYLFEIQYSWY